MADPRVSYFTVAGLFEAIHQVAKPIAQHIPEAGAREQAAQLPGKTCGYDSRYERHSKPIVPA